MGTEKVEKNVIFYYLVKVKREEKREYGAEFLLGSPFFFLSKSWRKDKGKWQWEKKLPPLFLYSTFNNKDIIVIFSFSFHFSIFSTKHMMKNTKFLSS